ncbi:MAG: glycosyltransferase family 4 protein [Mycobacterium sp.]
MSDVHTTGDECTSSESIALIVGPGDRFLSGISYYTALLTTALAQQRPVALLQLRKLCPRFIYPGRARVGCTDGMLPLLQVPTFNGLDWYWGPSALAAYRFWRRTGPKVLILQWWTGTVLHSYLALAVLAKWSDARLVIEFHEVQDVGEARWSLVRRLTRAGMGYVLHRADAVVVHSEYDRREICGIYPYVAGVPIEVIPHGPYRNHAGFTDSCGRGAKVSGAPRSSPRSEGPVRLLTFGVVRPYKGHAELAEAVRSLTRSGLDLHVSVVGEVWQGYRRPLDELAKILPADRLTVVDRYVDDADVPAFFAAADMVVLPYRRSSASGPLHIAMSCGLPVVTTAVGGLAEAAADYTGAVLVRPEDPVSLAEGIREALPLLGRTHADPHSWTRTAQRYAALLEHIGAGSARAAESVELAIPGGVA